MSGGVEGAGDVFKLIERLNIWSLYSYHEMHQEKARALFAEAAVALARLTAPPARTYAEGVEDAAKVAECAFDDRGNSRAGHHSQMDWEDGYRDATRAAAAAIRLLSQGEKA